MAKLILSLAMAVVSFAAAGKAQATAYRLRLNGLELSIDRQTGTLIELSFPATGLILQAPPKAAGLLDIAYPIQSFPAMRLASRFSKASVTEGSKSLTITYQELGPSRSDFPMPSGKVSAKIVIRAAPDGRSVIFSCLIRNHSSVAIPQILFPDLWGLRPFAGIRRTQLRLARGVVYPFMISFRPPQAAPAYYERVGWKEYPAGGYYTENALRWLDYGSLRGGLSIFQKKWGTPDKPDIFTYRSQADPGALRLDWQHKATIKPGQTWESGEFWLTPHPGGWAKGIEVFRQYVQQVDPPRALPPHVRNGIGFRTIWMAQPDDPTRAFFRFSDLPKLAREARTYGLTELVPWFWCSYFTLPIPLRMELGNVHDFITGIDEARRLGVNVAPFVSIHHINGRECSRYGIKPSASAGDNWTYHTDLIPQFRPYYVKFPDAYGALIDTANKRWQHDVLSTLTAWIDRGLYSFSFDEFVAKPGKTHGLVNLIEQVRSRARSGAPQSTFAAEAFDLERDGAVLDYTWNWVDYVDAGPILNVLRAPRLNCNIEDSPFEVKKCFAEDLYLNVMPSKPDEPNGTAWISAKPALAAALEQVSKLRSQFLPYFVNGIFLGDSFLAVPVPAFIRGYQLGKSLLVILLNTGTVARYFPLQFDPVLWLPQSANFEIKAYDSAGNLLSTEHGSGPRLEFCSGSLEPGDLALIEISAQ
jgi:hypothetical protein